MKFTNKKLINQNIINQKKFVLNKRPPPKDTSILFQPKMRNHVVQSTNLVNNNNFQFNPIHNPTND